MTNSFLIYLQQLMLIAFFSGYPLLYAITMSIAGAARFQKIFRNRVSLLLPFGYALAGTLYLGLQLKNLYPVYTLERIIPTIQQPMLQAWALLSLLFWIPALAKTPFLSLLHSLVFFSLVVRDLLPGSASSTADHVAGNSMKIYTVSLMVNVACFAFVLLVVFLVTRAKKTSR
jgi:hypothetical protein